MSVQTLAAALRIASRHRSTGSLTVRALAATLEVNTRESIAQSDLRALLGATDMQVSRAISTAVRERLIRRSDRAGPGGDRRRLQLYPTPDGRHLVQVLERAVAP